MCQYDSLLCKSQQATNAPSKYDDTFSKFDDIIPKLDDKFINNDVKFISYIGNPTCLHRKRLDYT